MKPITILLAAYKGEAYVGRQIESILAQDCDDWQLVLSDDGGYTDRLLARYASRYPNKILHEKHGKSFGSAKAHFMYLLEKYQDSPYLMFCDQDDVWHPDKVRRTFMAMKQAEEEEDLALDSEEPGDELPVLVHTDLRVVDGDLQEIDPSFMHYSRIRGDRLALRQLLVQNVVTGCTVMINRALAKKALQGGFREEIWMHDFWLALTASAFGKCLYLPEATIDYCQHGDNAVGAKNVRSLAYVRDKIKNGEMRASLVRAAAQAAAFEDIFGEELPEREEAALCAFAAAPKERKFRRLVTYVRYGLLKSDLRRAIGQILWW